MPTVSELIESLAPYVSADDSELTRLEFLRMVRDRLSADISAIESDATPPYRPDKIRAAQIRAIASKYGTVEASDIKRGWLHIRTANDCVRMVAGVANWTDAHALEASISDQCANGRNLVDVTGTLYNEEYRAWLDTQQSEPDTPETANDYGVRVGHIYIAADGAKYGYIVREIEPVTGDAACSPFDKNGVRWGERQRIDLFKLAKVRYSRVVIFPAWVAR